VFNNRRYSPRSIKIFKTTGEEDVDDSAISNLQFGLSSTNQRYPSQSIKIFKTGEEDVDELVKSSAILNLQFGLSSTVKQIFFRSRFFCVLLTN